MGDAVPTLVERQMSRTETIWVGMREKHLLATVRPQLNASVALPTLAWSGSSLQLPNGEEKTDPAPTATLTSLLPLTSHRFG